MAAQAVASAVRPCQPLQEVLEESQESIEEDLYQLLQPTQELPPSRSGRSRRQTASFNPDVEGLNDAALLAARRARGAPFFLPFFSFLFFFFFFSFVLFLAVARKIFGSNLVQVWGPREFPRVLPEFSLSSP